MDKKKIYNYVMNSPHNTNPNILKSLLNEPTSWNDLKDRPFYEETTEVGGDTLTWDGNTEGLVIATGELTAYLVSKAVPTLEDCANGGSTSRWGDDGTEIVVNINPNQFMQVADGVIILGQTFLAVADCATGKTIDGMGIMCPEPGVYATNPGMKQSITINGYTGFVTTKTMVKPIETKYLPEHLQFGTETKMVGGDTTELAIDSTGMEPSVVLGNMKFFYLSDAVVTIDDLANGYTVRFTNAQGEKKEISCTADEVGVLEPGKDKAIGIWELRFICVAEDNYEASSEGPLVFPKKGIYLYSLMSVKGLPPVSLTIPGYKGFVSEQTVVKPLDEKYLPDSVKGGGGILIVEILDDGTSSVPYDEVYTAFMAGKEIYLNRGTDLPSLTRLNGVNNSKFVWFTLDIDEDGDFDYNRYTLSADGKVTYSYFNQRVEVVAPM